MSISNAMSMVRDALRCAPVALAALAAFTPAHAQNSEWVGRTVGSNLARALAGSNSSGYGAEAAAALTGEWGASVGREMAARAQAKAADDAVRAQARRDVIYEAERRRAAQEMGIPYNELSQRSSNSMQNNSVSSFDRLIAAQMQLNQRQRQ